MTLKLSQTMLNELAAECGLSIMAVGSVEQLLDDSRNLESWQAAGRGAEMGYMYREPAKLSSPLALLPEARSVVCFAIFYDRAERPDFLTGFGRVARYAWGKDYHQVLKQRIAQLSQKVEAHLKSKIRWRGFSDAVPLLERALARRSGLGFIGKSSMLIRPGEGTYFFIAEVLWDIEISDPPLAIVDGHCGSCSACIDRCPAGAIVDERQVDARRCISYLTIEKRGSLSVQERNMLGEWIFGCDVCQDVCPFNHTALKEMRGAQLDDFGKEQGVGPMLDLKFLFGLNPKEFEATFKDTALLRPGRSGLIRNGVAVAANTAAAELLPSIERLFLEDSDAVVRSHALWALAEIEGRANSRGDAWIEERLYRGLADVDESVVHEARALLDGRVRAN